LQRRGEKMEKIKTVRCSRCQENFLIEKCIYWGIPKRVLTLENVNGFTKI